MGHGAGLHCAVWAMGSVLSGTEPSCATWAMGRLLSGTEPLCVVWAMGRSVTDLVEMCKGSPNGSSLSLSPRAIDHTCSPLEPTGAHRLCDTARRVGAVMRHQPAHGHHQHCQLLLMSSAHSVRHKLANDDHQHCHLAHDHSSLGAYSHTHTRAHTHTPPG